MRLRLLLCLLILPIFVSAQVQITVDLSTSTHSVSPFLYGRNNSLSGNPGSGFTPEWTKLKDARVRFFREGGGNNSTKYNWRRKLSSHPDWYNNVYANDWDFAVKSLQQNIPDAQGMWSFQLIGKAAKTTSANFGDWTWNGSQWWMGVNQNLAGGGSPNPALWSQVTSPGTAATTTPNPGNSALYLENWTADSTTLILDHWFNKLALDKDQLQYWSMDNEPEIWSGTHDDVMPTQLSAETFMQRYFEVAKKARQRYPEIKLVGPVPANEWQWYNWSGGSGGMAWLKFFIKRVAEEQTTSGVRLLDVLDIHFYPSTTNAAEIVQYHRVFFDKNYVYPEANGVKNVNGSWDNSQTKEYIIERCKDWLEEFMGADHGVTFSLSETGISDQFSPSTRAVWYGSTLGEFMKHPEMEIFTPWTWKEGMWEVLHLYSRYNKENFVQATSADEEFVSAYPTINQAGDSITVVLINRSTSLTKTVKVNFNNFDLDAGPFQTLRLSNLAASETFVSHATNALQKSMVTTSGNAVNLSLPPMSITTILLKGEIGEVTSTDDELADRFFNVYPNPAATGSKVILQLNQRGQTEVVLTDLQGRLLRTVYKGEVPTSMLKKDIELSGLSKGVYIFRATVNGQTVNRKISVY